MIPLPEYAKIKDNYCLAYNGHSRDYVVLLRILRPFIEREFPGLRVFICCRDEHMYIMRGQDRALGQSELDSKRSGFAYVRELSFNGADHPVEALMLESSIPFGKVSSQKMAFTGDCLLVPNAMQPCKSLSGDQIKALMGMANRRGAKVHTDIDWRDANWVVGVESEQLYEAAAAGKATTLVNTGFGKNLYSKLFPDGEIIDPP